MKFHCVKQSIFS